MNSEIYIYTDASFSKALELAVAGWLVFRSADAHEAGIVSSSMIRTQKFKESNNIRAEIRGTLLALEDVREERGNSIQLFTDCQTIVGLLDRREKLEASDFVSRAKNEPLANADLYKEFFSRCDLLQATIHWVKGHSAKGHRTFEQENFSRLDKAVRKELRKNV